MTFFDFDNHTHNSVGECTLTSYLKRAPSWNIVEHKIAMIVIQSILCPLGIAINIIYLKAYHSNSRLQNPSNLLLANLSLSNLFYIAFALPLNTVRHVMEIMGTHVCILWDIQQCSYLYLSGLSYMALLLISGERFVALFLPFRHVQVCTVPKTKRTIVIVWLSCATLMGLLHVGAFIFYSGVCIVIAITSVLIAVIHWKIFLEARKQRRNIFAERLSISRNVPGLVVCKSRRAEKNVGCIIGFMLVCSLPMVVYLVYTLIYGYTLFLLYVVGSWGDLLLFLNASGNPFVYCVRNRCIRQAMWNVFLRKN